MASDQVRAGLVHFVLGHFGLVHFGQAHVGLVHFGLVQDRKLLQLLLVLLCLVPNDEEGVGVAGPNSERKK